MKIQDLRVEGQGWEDSERKYQNDLTNEIRQAIEVAREMEIDKLSKLTI